DIALCSSDKAALAQAITLRLKTLAGEWFLDTQVGIPYLTEIFGNKRRVRYLEMCVASEIKATPGVRELRDFQVQISNNRAASISFVASLSDETAININESLGI